MEEKIVEPWLKGIILSLLLITFSIVLYLTDLSQNKTLGYLQTAVIFGGIIWSCMYYAKQMKGNVSFGNIFAHGFKTTSAMIAIFVVYTVIALKFLFPEMEDKAIEQAAKAMDARGDLKEDQIKQALSITRKFFLPFAIGGILFMYAIVGAIASAIGAAVSKKNPNPTPFEQ